MNIGSAAAGYGYEYVVSTMDRIKGAALGQNDNMLQMPIITPVSAETWAVKEATASEADMPEWGSADERGIDMEVMTAAADLAAGSAYEKAAGQYGRVADAVKIIDPRTDEEVK